MNYPWKYLIVSIATKIDIGTKFYKVINHDKESNTTFKIKSLLKRSSSESMRYAWPALSSLTSEVYKILL